MKNTSNPLLSFAFVTLTFSTSVAVYGMEDSLVHYRIPKEQSRMRMRDQRERSMVKEEKEPLLAFAESQNYASVQNNANSQQDDVAPKKWYQKAMEKTFSRVKNIPSMFYPNGRRVAEDFVQLKARYERAALQGDATVSTAMLNDPLR
jgi:TPR repeat protein